MKKTPIDTIREALEKAKLALAWQRKPGGCACDADLSGIGSHPSHTLECKEVMDADFKIDTALTSLKSLEGPRLTVDEVMRVHAECVDGNSIGDIQYIRYNVFREALTKAAKP